MNLKKLYYDLQNVITDSWGSPIISDGKWVNYGRFKAKIEPFFFFKDINDLWVNIESVLIGSTVNGTARVRLEKATDKDDAFRCIVNNLNNIYSCLRCVYDALKIQYEGSETNSIEIKMPADIDLDSFSKCTGDLNKVFTQCPFLSSDDGKIVFSGVERGSVLLTFVVTGGVITILVGLAALVDKAVQISSHVLTTKEQLERLRKIGIDNKLIEELKKTHEEVERQLKENAIRELAEKNNIDDPEEKQRIEYSLDKLSKWIDKGLEIHAAIGASDEIKALFPPVEMPSLPIGKKELLEAAKSDSEQ